MFDKLREAVKKLASGITEKELTEERLQASLEDFQLRLISNDTASPVAEEIISELKDHLIGRSVKRLTDPKEVIQQTLEEKIQEILQKNRDLMEEVETRVEDNLELIKEREPINPFKIMFIGPNGAGKTTSIAKVAWKLKQKEVTSVLVASDTFRAGAQEQLREHSEKLGLPLIEGEYGRDPASVGYDGVHFAKSKQIHVVLIDTAGRLGGDINLIEEMKKMERIIGPNVNIFVGSALSGNELANQAIKFREGVDIDGNILTKVDADIKGGAALTLAYASEAPILWVGTGQRYSDLRKFETNWFVKQITS
ncbi:MAG: signal recognition particle-docking protein FtsY [Candidatus Korarchaeota archaeon]|nr:signal recognition particle-docking protein FtsY [Candidatus Korarchaeota archaeon]NIU85505.1 signal recognition particle-docking protein FtsY [Candidatus Thorarchaeota archaeon]NIW15622.1 signal recognition particle-docking protein FtsY [Candidatus Thorarchaeota archaeon]NIW53553.1 signal recognition particle-docking protein FtsY [Candidatus Korarchaeota archaeon]